MILLRSGIFRYNKKPDNHIYIALFIINTKKLNMNYTQLCKILVKFSLVEDSTEVSSPNYANRIYSFAKYATNSCKEYKCSL